MKIKVNILLGFLGSGKSTLINNLLTSKKLKNEKIVLLMYESGSVCIRNDMDNIVTIQKKSVSEFSENTIKEIILDYNPDRIIIEYNGMADTEEFLKKLSSNYIKRFCYVEKVICTINMKTGKMYMLNMAEMFRRQIVNSDIVIFNNTREIKSSYIKDVKRNVKNINEVAKIYEFKDEKEEEKTIIKNKLCFDTGEETISFNDAFFSALFILFLTMVLIFSNNITDFMTSFMQNELFSKFKNIFMGIIIETVPFILLGAFVSSIIQIGISEDTIAKIIPKNKLFACVIASILGVIFPVCDCGTIPVARGFLKKGLPLSVAVTFMLAAPIVNPIAIMSSYYAFSDISYMVIYRIVLGITIAIIVGLLMNRYSSKEVVSNYIMNCQCELCSGIYVGKGNVLKKIKSIFVFAADEFINVGKYMVVGAAVSAIMQVLLEGQFLSFVPEGKVAQLVMMMVMAFVLSVCSTSDSFIAKGFLKNFSQKSIMGFLVLGPMIDIKNTIMLFGSFKKSFVLKLLLCIIVISFLILLVVPL